MTISRRSLRQAPSFLDRSSGFYGRLEEKGAAKEGKGRQEGGEGEGPGGLFEDNHGMLQDDAAQLLPRQQSKRRSRRWRRETGNSTVTMETEDRPPSPVLPGSESEKRRDYHATTEGHTDAVTEMTVTMAATKHPLIHFGDGEGADDQVLIQDKKMEKRRGKGVVEEGGEMKVAKRSTLKRYKKAFDRAFRRGWEAFITNLHTITLAPVSSSPSSSPSSSSPQKSSFLKHSSNLGYYK
ncbi:uncharacterized protein LOC136764728 isoform X2 [Amia ocellicauda]|uniref:uncharacterized protein LOC136764728 isoform X2 n=1 Tax=Amia ocellicauda TaxID=2972642 RepID=UPI003463CFC4